MAAVDSLVERITSRGLAFKRLNVPSEDDQGEMSQFLDTEEKRDWRTWWREAADRYAQCVAEKQLLQQQAFPGGPSGALGSQSPRKRLRKAPSLAAEPPHSRSPYRQKDGVASTAGEEGSARLQVALSDVSCSICCNVLSASEVFRLPCGHGWYCKRCIERYAEMRIGAGAPRIDCPECLQPVAEHILNELLPSNLLIRLQAQSLEQAVLHSGDMWSCPTPDCPMRVAVEAGAPNCFECPLCEKTACVRCSAQPFHKGVSCRRHQERAKRRSLEGFMEWMRATGSKQCPNCGTAVTKQNLQQQSTQRVECHKMMCRACRTRFCFKCLMILTDTNTCQCTSELHGFVDPTDGRRVEHLKKGSTATKQTK